MGQNAHLAWRLRKHDMEMNGLDAATCRCGEVFMASETELFYLVLLIFLTLIIHVILSWGGHHRNGQAHR
jgi:hypothetical protein